MWSIVFGFVKSIVSKLNWKGFLILSFSLLLWYLFSAGKTFIIDLASSLKELKSQNNTLAKQNKAVINSNKVNAEAYLIFKKNIVLSDAITEKLIKKVEGIQNVKITEKTIIQTAQSNCLDKPYPGSIINSGILRWNEKNPAAEDSNSGTNNE